MIRVVCWRVDVLHAIRRSLGLLSDRHRKQMHRLVALNAVGGLFDMLGILLLVPLLGVLSGAGNVAVPTFLRVTGEDAERLALWIALAAAAAFFLKSVYAIGLLWVQTGVLSQAPVDVAGRLLSRFGAASRLLQKSTTTGETARNAYVAVTAAVADIGAAFLGIVADISVLAAVLAALFIANPLLALCAVGYLALIGFVYARLLRGPLVARGRIRQQSHERMTNSLIEFIGGLPEFMLRGGVPAQVSRFAEDFAQVNEAQRVFAVTNAATRYLLETAILAGAAIIMLVATLTGGIQDALVSIGLLLAAGFRALPALSDLIVLVNTVRTHEPGLAHLEEEFRRLDAMRESVPEVDGRVDWSLRQELLATRNAVGLCFQDVTFSYGDAASPTLEHISFDLSPGQSLGVVGASGAGKSTLVDLALGFLAPTSGRVFSGDVEVRNAIPTWRSLVAVVPQDVFILTGTIRENIIFRDTFEDETHGEKLKRACRLAQLDSWVATRPLGLDSWVGERGALLSGGQRQRIGLARALFRDPALLILDEATSALDNETEFLVSEAIDALRADVTTIVIAHRLTTLRHCDRLLFLEDGCIAGQGSFQELHTGSSSFRRLVELGQI
jgi:ATP-binding cassette, subfamily B, bacterial PglK